MTHVHPYRPVRGIGGSIVLALLVGYPLGVLGTACVAIVTLTITSVAEGGGALQGFGWGLFGGFLTGLITGGPVFAVLSVRRPMDHAWVRVFGACQIASLAGMLFDLLFGATSIDSALLFWAPVIVLPTSALVYFLRTRHLSPIPPRLGAEYKHLCNRCEYDLRGLPEDEVCPECGAPGGSDAMTRVEREWGAASHWNPPGE